MPFAPFWLPFQLLSVFAQLPWRLLSAARLVAPHTPVFPFQRHAESIRGRQFLQHLQHLHLVLHHDHNGADRQPSFRLEQLTLQSACLGNMSTSSMALESELP